jgi:hypothetical protein
MKLGKSNQTRSVEGDMRGKSLSTCCTRLDPCRPWQLQPDHAHPHILRILARASDAPNFGHTLDKHVRSLPPRELYPPTHCFTVWLVSLNCAVERSSRQTPLLRAYKRHLSGELGVCHGRCSPLLALSACLGCQQHYGIASRRRREALVRCNGCVLGRPATRPRTGPPAELSTLRPRA